MIYTDRFDGTDKLITHLTSVINTISDPEIKASYAGFLSVSSVTVYELSIKDIFFTFAEKKNLVLANVITAYFRNINGMIKIEHLKGKHIKIFGDKYLNKFDKLLELKEQSGISNLKISIKSSYDNLITCRHQFVHRGLSTLTLNEVIEYYQNGKEVIHCLNNAMKR